MDSMLSNSAQMRSPMAAQLERVDKAIADQAELVKTLQAKLAPVTRSMPTGPAGEDQKAPELMSPTVKRIRTQADALNVLGRKLRDMIETVEM